jgi:hypothetical protein
MCVAYGGNVDTGVEVLKSALVGVCRWSVLSCVTNCLQTLNYRQVAEHEIKRNTQNNLRVARSFVTVSAFMSHL